MNEEKKRFSPPAVGGSSLLVIFAVLCLTIFALLSMSTVQADKRLADAAVQTVSGYYRADTQAEEILALLRTGERPEGVTFTDNGVLTASYSCAITDNQTLMVEILFPDGLGGEYEIARWQSVYTGDWEPDDTINVWDGN